MASINFIYDYDASLSHLLLLAAILKDESVWKKNFICDYIRNEAGPLRHLLRLYTHCHKLKSKKSFWFYQSEKC